MNGMTRRDIVWGGLTLSALAAVAPGRAQRPEGSRHSFRPGEIWTDTSGKPIQAHGGSIVKVDDTFYWYGENKEFTVPKSKIWTWGVRCYASRDLYNWDDLGLIIPPDERDPTSPLNPVQSPLDRPHILYNQRTKKFVCWIKIMSGGQQTRTVLVADKITGPYSIVRKGIRPLGMNAGDFDTVISPADGKAYMYFERVHSEMICADLTDDYTDFTGYYSTHFPHPSPPLVREGPAYFFRHGRHYLATSGTTGYYPNPSEVAVADTYHGPWTVLGDLHRGDRTESSFNSQISSVFRHPAKKDLYIALADRWMGPLDSAAFESGQASRDMRNGIGKALDPDHPALSTDEKHALGGMMSANTSVARYVWLPIRFEGNRPVIEWRDEWSLDEFA